MAGNLVGHINSAMGPAAAGTADPDDKRKLAVAESNERAIWDAYEHHLKTTSTKAESQVSKNLETKGLTIKLGFTPETTLDTGIPWVFGKKALAATIAAGHEVGSVARGVAQIAKQLGIADVVDEEVEAQNSQIMQRLRDDPEYGSAATVGMVVGAVAEPIGFLLPASKARAISKAFRDSSIIGAMYGSALYVDEGESRMTNAILGAATMGPAGAVVAKWFPHVVGDEVASRVTKMEDTADDIAKSASKKQKKLEYKTKQEAYEYQEAAARVQKEADMEMGFRSMESRDPRGRLYSKGDYDRAVAKTQAEFEEEMAKLHVPPKGKGKKPKKTKVDKGAKIKTEEEIVEDIERRVSMKGPTFAKLGTMGNLITQAIEPLYDNVARYSKKVAAQLRIADGRQHLWAKQWHDRVDGFNKWFHSMPIEQQAKLHHLMANNGFGKPTMQFIQQQGGDYAVSQVEAVKDVLATIFKNYKEVGYKVNSYAKKGEYFPTAVRPQGLEYLVQNQMTDLDRLVKAEQKRQGGRPLSTNQKAHLAERYFSFDVKGSTTAAQMKKRKKFNVKEEELQYYHDPITTLHYYISTAAEDISKRQFFKDFGYKPNSKKGLDITGSDLGKSVDALIDQLSQEVPNMTDQRRLNALLSSRFSADVHKTHRFVQALKNASYAGTLGNFWSAMTQVGDLVFAMHKYGIRATAESMLGPKITSKERLGIDKAMQELVDPRDQAATNRLANWAFKWSGFDKVDTFGKNVNINASLRSNQKLAQKDPAKFMAKWSDHFGDETQALMEELHNLKRVKDAPLSDNAHLMLWNDLADTQPIGLSEMPKKYLDMPNGRVLYAYKTFAMKQFNYMRNQLKGAKPGYKKAYDITYFMAMFVAANSTVDSAKDFLSGKEINLEDKVMDNFISMFGTSKYAVDKSRGLGDIIAQGIVPVPISQGLGALNKISTGDVGAGDVVDQLPIVGKANRDWDIIR